MSHTSHPHIVIGGGISGLGAAYLAARAGTPTLVLERSARIGGCIHTHRFDNLHNFWIEAGSHSCFNSYGTLLDMLEQRHHLSRIVAKTKVSYRLWRQGKRRTILSALHPVELLTSLPTLQRLNKAECSVKEYYGRGLGMRNYRDLFGPAFRSVICQPPDDFPAAALFRKKPRRKRILRSFTMPGGLSDIAALIAGSDGLEVRTDQTITALTRDAGDWQLTLADGSQLTTPRLTLAVPPDVTAQLLTTSHPQIAALVGQIGMAEIDTLVLIFAKATLKLPELAGLISVDGQFLSAVSRDFRSDPRYRGFSFHFPGGEYSETDQVAAACAALGTQPPQVLAQMQVRNRLPALRQGHHLLVAELNQLLAGQPLAITGNWFAGVAIEDCLLRSASEMQRLLTS
ncbi:protoporphyrinogen/coproporphyrinogen oxidase [Thiospirillum jenense]|uniref:FAD-dependent oxidoreductase n=1 Tax=Thiospirillum jenense TaxID=1653858 RepID=A0A839H581_9GAMM|nr:FAD-dependent oxidoreductase [Thiospirillum jenense]MBB1125163.1 FAD-dependent oxidoreductase [Thiospirillum jenense]